MHRCNCRVEGCHHEAEFDVDFLLRMVKRGDPAALNRLLERYRNYIMLLVRLQLGCRSGGRIDFERTHPGNLARDRAGPNSLRGQPSASFWPGLAEWSRSCLRKRRGVILGAKTAMLASIYRRETNQIHRHLS